MDRPQYSGMRPAKLLVIGFLALLLNTSYLASNSDPTLFHYSNVAAHILGGLGLSILFIYYLIRRFRELPLMVWIGAVLLLAGSGVGAVLVYIYNTHNHRWVFQLHIGLSLAGAVLMFGYLLMRSKTDRSSQPRRLSLVKTYSLFAIVALG